MNPNIIILTTLLLAPPDAVMDSNNFNTAAQ